jgi:hypothetical protein
MPVELQISELDDYTKCIEYINSKNDNQHITTKMIIKNCHVQPKIANRVLRQHSDTMLCSPHEFGSAKYVNYNLYKKVNTETIKRLCNSEIKNKIKNVKEINKDNFIKNSLSELLYNKYRININSNIVDLL